jgi:large subunit ribosomal protein L9
MRKSRDLRDAASREAAEAQRTIIEAQSLSIAARAGANGRLFGSVTEADVVNALRTATGISLDRHLIHMTEHLKEVGATTVTATLFEGVDATINVEITAK